jgi:hypothetical protein
VFSVLTHPQQVDTDADAVADGADNCPLWANGTQALPPWPGPAGDSDCDGFPNATEQTIGTLPTVQCPVAGSPSPSPPPPRATTSNPTRASTSKTSSR